MAPSVDDGTGRKCQMCAEIVRAEAIKCRFCGADLPIIPTAKPAVIAEEFPVGNANRGYLYIAVICVAIAASLTWWIMSL